MPEHRSGSHPLLELTRVRLREFLREPEAIFWVFVFPILMACALGIAFRNTGPDVVKVAVVADGPVTSERADALRQSKMLDVAVLAPDEAMLALRTGKVALLVESSGDGVAYRFDPARPESRTARLEVDDALQRAAGRLDPLTPTNVEVSEAGARYIDWLIPGLIGINMMGSGMWGLGFAIVTARKNRLLKRLSATPMRRSHYLLSFMFSRYFFLAIEVTAILGFSALVFDVPVRGSILAIAVTVWVGGTVFSGLGLLVAARPSTIEGVSGLMNFVMLPMWLLSGTFFASDRFPAAFQPFIRILPLTAFNDALRAIVNEGATLPMVAVPLGILAIWAVVSFAVALKLFRWQ